MTNPEKIPDTFLEALSIAAILSEALGYDQSRLAMAIDGTDLHVGVPDEKLHFLAGPLPSDCVGSSHASATSARTGRLEEEVFLLAPCEPGRRASHA